MRLLDLFSGIGGFSLGLERAGFETMAFCEINPKCRHLLATHWPGVPCFDDITTLTGEQVGPVDAICGGFPCQDISFAGKGAGLAGERSGLWREYARLVRELRPRFVIVENVSALLGRGLGDVLGDLAALGYDAWWDCIPASAVGAPHRRDRLWLVAYPGGIEHQGYGDALRREIAAGLSRAAAEQGVCARHGCEAYALNPDSDRIRPYRPRVHLNGGPELRDEQVGDAEPMGSNVADAESERQPEARQLRCYEPSQRIAGRGEACGKPGAPAPNAGWPVDDAMCGRHRASEGAIRAGRDRPFSAGWWQSEPDVGRTLDGFSRWLDESDGDPEAHKVVLDYANASDSGPGKALRDLRDCIRAEDDRRAAGGPIGVSPEAVLFAFVREYARRTEEGLAPLESPAPPAERVRSVRRAKGAPRPSLRSGRDEQRSGEPSDPLQVVSQLLARHAEAAWVAYRWPDARASQRWVHGWEDGIARVANGVPARVDRLHGLGNAVVPQIPEIIGRAIIAADQAMTLEAAA